MPPVPIDPPAGPALAVAGRVVKMDAAFTVLDDGVVYLSEGRIVAVQSRGDPPPAGFEGLAPVAVGGTIYPGLIELHNHLAYNALQLWDVPRQFTNRGQWGGIADYRRLVSGPMKLIGPDPALMPAVVRYVECKALVAGTTTSQGIEIFSNKGARRLYRGNIRNVEETDDPELPGAGTRIGDVDGDSARGFLDTIRRKPCYILHLSEGVDDAARAHFLALKLGGRQGWAITDSLAGIHCAGLEPQDFEVLADHGASMVWSPLSNLLLYGATANVKAARDAGVKIGLGADWAPSGSKNLLGELKVAHLASSALGGVFDDRELVAMVTRTAAEILKWERALGSLEPGKRSDLVVVDGVDGDPYGHLIGAGERDVALVMVGGVPRYGKRSLVERLGGEPPFEDLRVGGRRRVLNLRQETADPVVGTITLAEAGKRLSAALKNLKELAEKAERAGSPLHALLAGPDDEVRWGLALDELEPTGFELRPRIPLGGRPTGPSLATAAAGKPLSEIVGPLELDVLTVADDHDWLDRIDAERNLPDWVAPGLRKLYGG